MLEVAGVSVHYGSVRVLHGISFKVGEGEIVTLIGTNGAGKSTAMMAVSGLAPVVGGDIFFDGASLRGVSPDRIVSLGISQVPEGRRIFPQLSVLENLDLGAYLRRDRAGVREDLDYVFSLFPILAERRHQSGGTLSGGEQQMLAISRALMARPRLLLLDEPSLGLAPIIIKRIFAIIARINQEHGTTIVLVEQNANLALHAAHRGYVMENGRIVLADTAANLLGCEQVRTAYLGI